MSKNRYVYVVDVPEGSGIDGIFSTASKAISRLKEYGPVARGSVRALMGGKSVYVQASDDDEHPQTHAYRWLLS
jgi:hypothetical protein